VSESNSVNERPSTRVEGMRGKVRTSLEYQEGGGGWLGFVIGDGKVVDRNK
jgi:hypothetical protein